LELSDIINLHAPQWANSSNIAYGWITITSDEIKANFALCILMGQLKKHSLQSHLTISLWCTMGNGFDKNNYIVQIYNSGY
jgi:hypothetical protein